MKKIIYFLVLVLIVFTACNKNDEPFNEIVAEVVTGSLSGTAGPVGSVKNILLVQLNSDSKSYQVIPDPITGFFSIKDVPVGDYMMYCSPAEDFLATQLAVRIDSRKNSVLGVVMEKVKEKNHALSCKVNGQFQGWILKAYMGSNSNLLQITNYSSGSSLLQYDGTVKYHLSISISDFTGPGTYICNASSGNRISYNGYTSILMSSQNTGLTGSGGVIVITSVDPVAKLIKGTFTASLAARSTSSNDARELTDGLINVYY